MQAFKFWGRARSPPTKIKRSVEATKETAAAGDQVQDHEPSESVDVTVIAADEMDQGSTAPIVKETEDEAETSYATPAQDQSLMKILKLVVQVGSLMSTVSKAQIDEKKKELGSEKSKLKRLENEAKQMRI